MAKNFNPSITALSVAKGVSLCQYYNNFSHLIDHDKAKLYEMIVSQVVANYPYNFGTILFKSICCLPYTLQIKFLDNVVSKGYVVHMAMRKLMIEQKIIEAIDNGTKQVVICGAGYDVLCLYLHIKYPDVIFYELDLEQTQQLKLNTIKKLNPPDSTLNDELKKIAKHYIRNFENLRFVPCNLSNNLWCQCLYNQGFNKNEPSIVIAEGLTMYLPEIDVKNILNILKFCVLNNKKSKLIISFIDKYIQDTKISEYARKETGEEYLFTLPLKDVNKFVYNHGLIVEEYITRISFQEQAGNYRIAEYLKNNIDKNVDENYFVLRNKGHKEFLRSFDDCKLINVNIAKPVIKKKSNLIRNSTLTILFLLFLLYLYSYNKNYLLQ